MSNYLIVHNVGGNPITLNEKIKYQDVTLLHKLTVLSLNLCTCIYLKTFYLKKYFTFQATYNLASFITLIPGKTEQLNHFISYKEIDKEWYKYDDQEVDHRRLCVLSISLCTAKKTVQPDIIGPNHVNRLLCTFIKNYCILFGF